MEYASDESAKRIAELLIEKGFATRHILDTTSGFGDITWTRKGRALHRYLRDLFDLPGTPLAELDPNKILAVISLILFTEPL
jgi:hypothetical protein